MDEEPPTGSAGILPASFSSYKMAARRQGCRRSQDAPHTLLPSHPPSRLLHRPPMNVSLIWDKLSKVTLFLLVVALLLFAFLQYLPLIRTNQNYRKELLAAEARVAEQERLGRQLRASM